MLLLGRNLRQLLLRVLLSTSLTSATATAAASPSLSVAALLFVRLLLLGVELGWLASLGAEGVIPGRYIVSLLRVFKQFTHTLPSR